MVAWEDLNRWDKEGREVWNVKNALSDKPLVHVLNLCLLNARQIVNNILMTKL